MRSDRPIETTLELVDIIKSAMPERALREKQHPAKRSFQAIRIAVNDELGAVSRMMRASIDHLNPGGRLCVITFHSLEDRIVKNAMLDAAKGCTCPPSFPVCVCGRTPKIQVLTKKPIIATMEEVRENPAPEVQKLRVAVKPESKKGEAPWLRNAIHITAQTARQPMTSTPQTPFANRFVSRSAANFRRRRPRSASASAPELPLPCLRFWARQSRHV